MKCKNGRVKCPEEKPKCSRCLRLGAACEYKSQPKGQPFLRAILPFHAASESRDYPKEKAAPRILPPIVNSLQFLVQPRCSTMESGEVVYFDHFRNHIMHQLGGLGLEEFWSRTVLRESATQDYVLDAILGISALVQARRTTDLIRPLNKSSIISHQSGAHYHRATRYYVRALSRYRGQISSETITSPRTVLIATLLFVVFELLQGDTDAVNKLTASSLVLLKDALEQAVITGTGTLATTIDDAAIHNAQFFLLRAVTNNSLYSPMYPLAKSIILNFPNASTAAPEALDHTHSLGEFWATWWRFVTLMSMWYFRLYTELRPGRPVPEALVYDRNNLLGKSQRWDAAAQQRLDAEKDPATRSILRVACVGTKVVYITTIASLDVTGVVWDSQKDACEQMLRQAQSVIDDVHMAPSRKDLGIIYDGLIPGILQIARQCRIWEVRLRALTMASRLINQNSGMDVKSFFLGAKALVSVEEEGRNAAGIIPISSRYDWTDGVWSDDYASFQATLRAKIGIDGEAPDERHIKFSSKDFHFIYEPSRNRDEPLEPYNALFICSS